MLSGLVLVALAWHAAALSPACDIVVAGGSLASLAAAITAANASSAHVCFLDPTDWPGGQLTASAVPAIDFGIRDGLLSTIALYVLVAVNDT